jgi:electron transport complex protein RnfD
MSDATNADGPAIRPAPPVVRARAHYALHSSPLHSGIQVKTFLGLYLFSLAFPVAMGLALYGWRALGTILTVVASAVLALAILREIGWRGQQARLWHCACMGILVALMLPPHLFVSGPIYGRAVWPLIPAAGVTLALLTWLLGGLGMQRVPPAVVTVLLLFVFFHETLTPHFVLRCDRAFAGDIFSVDWMTQPASGRVFWLNRTPATGFDAVRMDPVGDELLSYTSAQQRPDRSSLTMQMMLRDRMPPLENLVIGGECSSIGAGSAMAVILGGLFLLYQGLIDFRIPLVGVISAMVAMLILPVPILITDIGPVWRWLTFRPNLFGAGAAVTFVNYEILSSPLLLMLFFIATMPGLRPMTRRARVIYAIALGVLSAVFQLYASVSMGPLLALMAVTLLSPTLDNVMRARTLV